MSVKNNTCDNCKFWSPEADIGIGQCRKSDPRIIDKTNLTSQWPKTSHDDWCGQFSPTTKATFGSDPKVSDQQIVDEILNFCSIMDDPSKAAMPRAMLMSWLCNHKHMTQTPAMSRLKTMIRRGIIQQGDNPWPQNDSGSGIHVWVVTKDEAAIIEAGRRGRRPVCSAERFMELAQQACPTPEQGVSFRMLWRIISATVPMSASAAHRLFTPLVSEGLIQTCEKGYYAPSAPESPEAAMSVE